jgi:hypothetical protein
MQEESLKQKAAASRCRRQSWYLISCSDRRQWRRVSIPVASPLQDGENPHGDDNTTAAREDADMAVWFKRRLQCLHCEESALFDAEIAPGAGRPRTPANDCRNNVLRTQGRAHALNHGGTIA